MPYRRLQKSALGNNNALPFDHSSRWCGRSRNHCCRTRRLALANVNIFAPACTRHLREIPSADHKTPDHARWFFKKEVPPGGGGDHPRVSGLFVADATNIAFILTDITSSLSPGSGPSTPDGCDLAGCCCDDVSSGCMLERSQDNVNPPAGSGYRAVAQKGRRT